VVPQERASSPQLSEVHLAACRLLHTCAGRLHVDSGLPLLWLVWELMQVTSGSPLAKIFAVRTPLQDLAAVATPKGRAVMTIFSPTGPLESLTITNGTLVLEVAIAANMALCLKDVSSPLAPPTLPTVLTGAAPFLLDLLQCPEQLDWLDCRIQSAWVSAALTQLCVSSVHV
jgi:hypothetical protein